MPTRKVPAIDILQALYEQGLSCREIALRYDVAGHTVERALRRSGIARRSPQETIALQKLRGIHPRPSATRFQPGQIPQNKVSVGTLRIRRDKKTTTYRAWIKIAEPNCWKLRAVVTWEHAYGPTPPGYVVHHIDHDALNDSLDNLCIRTRAEHLMEHSTEIRALGREAARKACEKLTYEQAETLRQEFQEGWSNRELRHKYGLSKATVTAIIHYRTYKKP